MLCNAPSTELTLELKPVTATMTEAGCTDNQLWPHPYKTDKTGTLQSRKREQLHW